jgi:hypothetical protein
MRRMKQGPVEQHRRRMCRLNNYMTSEVEQLRRRGYSQRNHKTLKEGVRKKKNLKEFRNMKRWRIFQQEKQWK